MYKKLIALLTFTTLLFVNVYAAPLSTNVLVSELEPNVGQDVSITLRVNGNVDNPIFTLSSKINYDSVKLKFKSATILEEGVIPLTEVPYHITDTDEGVVVRTAGFPKGYTKSASFIRYTFQANKKGQAYIYFQGGQALNSDNEDVGVEKKEILLNIGGEDFVTESVTGAAASATTAPKVNILEKKKSQAFYVSAETAVCQEKDYDFTLVFKEGTNLNVQGRYLVSLFGKDGNEIMKKEVESVLVDSQIKLRLNAGTLPVGSMLLRVSNQNVKQISDKEIGVMKCRENTILQQVDGQSNDFKYQIALGIFALILAGLLIFTIWEHEHFKHMTGRGVKRK